METNKQVLEIINLKKYYGDIRGVEDVSLTLNKGEIYGFIGPNGAGKSTTIRTIMNLINKTSGTILIDGKEFNKDDIELKKIIGYLPSEINLYSDLTVKETIDFHLSFYKENLNKRRKYLVSTLKLDESKKIDELSFGNLKKVGIVLALIHNPKILILDEATNGLDPIMQNIFFELLLEEKKKGTTILYSTHILGEVSKVCDRIGFIKEGIIIEEVLKGDINNKNITYLTIESNDIEGIEANLNLKVIEKNNNTIKFINNLLPNQLMKKISKYKIEKLLIEEVSIEDLFIEYYK